MEEHKGTIESRALTATALVRQVHIKPASLIHQKSGETTEAGLMSAPFLEKSLKKEIYMKKLLITILLYITCMNIYSEDINKCPWNILNAYSKCARILNIRDIDRSSFTNDFDYIASITKIVNDDFVKVSNLKNYKVDGMDNYMLFVKITILRKTFPQYSDRHPKLFLMNMSPVEIKACEKLIDIYW